MNETVRTENLGYVYGPGTPFSRRALENVNFTAREGEFLAIIGHTGSGKSTLVQQLNGLLRPTEGKVMILGRNIWEKPEEIRKVRFQVGLVFQYPEYQLFEETVAADIAFGPKNRGLTAPEIEYQVQMAAEFVGISKNLFEKSPFELSGGQKRRVAIAGVLAMEPAVLILDEPTAGLDPRGRVEILDRIRDYQRARGNTVIIVTHSMEDAARVASRIVVMNRGSILRQGTPAEIFGHGEELAAAGLSVPQVTRVFMRLKALGVPVNPAVYTVAQAKEEILRLKGEMRHA